MRTLVKTPAAVNRVSKNALHIIKLCNLARIGVNIDIKELSVHEAHYMEYYGMMVRKQEEEIKFKYLGNLFKAAFGKR